MTPIFLSHSTDDTEMTLPIGARLASQAAAGEILISQEVGQAAGVDVSALETRTLDLKGRNEEMAVRVMEIGAP